jgi:hypothetical protein
MSPSGRVNGKEIRNVLFFVLNTIYVPSHSLVEKLIFYNLKGVLMKALLTEFQRDMEVETKII